MIFVDTSAWFALTDRSCSEHAAALQFALESGERFVTTDYVFSESLTLLRARHLHRPAIELGTRLLAEEMAKLERVTAEDFHQAWLLFQYRDKEWSFVDCTCFAVMRRLNINRAFAFDDHFRQVGSISVFPQPSSL